MSSKVTFKAPELNMICHGCHGPMGDGLHNGSRTGKNSCLFLHSLSCPGNISENESWKPCPPNYQPGLVSSDIGFEQTLDQVDFLPHTGSNSSTPHIGPPGAQYQTPVLPHVKQQHTSEDDLSRFQRQVNGEGARARVIQ